jgi:hypothetical protein
MNFISLAEKKINDEMDKMFGDKDNELKVLTKFARFKELYGEDKELNQQVCIAIEKIRHTTRKEAAMITDELKCVLDSSGNVILLNTKD